MIETDETETKATVIPFPAPPIMRDPELILVDPAIAAMASARGRKLLSKIAHWPANSPERRVMLGLLDLLRAGTHPHPIRPTTVHIAEATGTRRADQARYFRLSQAKYTDAIKVLERAERIKSYNFYAIEINPQDFYPVARLDAYERNQRAQWKLLWRRDHGDRAAEDRLAVLLTRQLPEWD